MNLDTTISEILADFSSKTQKIHSIPYEAISMTPINDTSILISNQYTVSVFDISTQKVSSEKKFDSQILSTTSTPNYVFLAQESSIYKYSLPDLTYIETFSGHTESIMCLKVVGNTLVSGSDDYSVRLWELDSLIEIKDRVLYSHENKVRALDLDCELKFVASLGYEGYIIVFNYEKTVEIAKFEGCYSSYICRISSQNRTIVSTDNNYVYLWDMDEFNRVERVLHDRCINALDVCGEFIYTCSSDKKVIKMSLKTLRSITITKTEFNINTLYLSGKTIYASLENSTILVMNESESVEEQNILIDPIKVICFCEYSESLFVFGEKNEENVLKIIDLVSFDIKKSVPIKKSIIKMAPLTDALLSIDSENEVFFLDNEGSIIKTTEILASIVDYNLNNFVVQNQLNISLYNYPELVPIFTYPRNSSISTLSLEESEIIISEYNGDIKIIDTLDINKKTVNLLGHQTKLTIVRKSRNKKFILSADQQFIFIIWDSKSGSILRKIEETQVSQLYFTLDLNFAIIFSQSSHILILSLNNLEVFSIINTKYGTKESVVTNDETGFFLLEIEDLYYIKNPLLSQEITVIGANKSESETMEYILSLNFNFKYDSNMNTCLIMPYKLNILHFYAYFNNPDCLFKAISTNGAFIVSTNSYSVLSISLQRNFEQCIRSIYRGLVEKLKSNPYVLTGIEDCLIDLNNSGFKNAYKFYNLFLQSVNYNLPKFCSSAIKLPIIRKYSEITSEFEWSTGLENENLQAIKYSQSFVGLYVEVGSSSSIMFLQSLINCCNSEIFNTNIIQVVLSDKWDQLKVYLYLETGIHICYLTLISVYSSYDKPGILASAFVMNVLLLIYEIWQMLASSKMYIKSIKNWLELTNFILILIFCILTWSQISIPELFSVLMFTSWLRGVTIFRLFSSTRYYINLLINVLIDIYPFFLIFAYSTVGFGLVFQALDNTSTVYFNYLTSAYLTDLGNADSSGYTKLHWLFFLLITVLNQIVMLNLIVSIMSDTYLRVRQTSLQADSIELTNMLIEVETMMFWKRGFNNKVYFFICEEGASIEESEDIKYKMKKIKGFLKGFENTVKENHEVYVSSLQDISSKTNYAYMGLMELNRQIPKNFR